MHHNRFFFLLEVSSRHKVLGSIAASQFRGDLLQKGHGSAISAAARGERTGRRKGKVDSTGYTNEGQGTSNFPI
jgi:hypothetical protein